MIHLTSRQYGILLVAASALLWSTAGLFVRMADLDSWTIVAWRSLFACLTLAALLARRGRSEVTTAFRHFGRPGLAAVAISVISTFTYVAALRLTSVANVMTVYAALPFIASGIAFLWLGERVSRRFIVAGSIALCGIAVMAGAAASADDVTGIASAVAMTTGFALQLVYTKRHPELDMTLMSTLAAVACVAVAAPLAQAGVPPPFQLAACALFGILTTGFAYLFVLTGGRLISSGETGFISMVDVVLGPLWVWIFYAERPGLAVLVGGALVLASVAWYLATQPATVPRPAGSPTC